MAPWHPAWVLELSPGGSLSTRQDLESWWWPRHDGQHQQVTKGGPGSLSNPLHADSGREWKGQTEAVVADSFFFAGFLCNKPGARE